MTRSAFHVVLVSQEPTRPGLLRRAAAGEDGLDVDGFTTADLAGERAGTLERALADADLVLASHVLVDGDARRLLELLDRTERPGRHVVALSSLREVMRRTRLGDLRLDRPIPAAGPAADASPLPLLGGLLSGGDMTGSLRELREQLPRLLDRLPPAAGDLRSYAEACLYWAEPTPRHLRDLLLMLADRYGSAPGGHAGRYAPPERHPAVGLYHPETGILTSLDGYPRLAGARAAVALLVMRGAVLAGDTGAIDAVVGALAARGIDAITCFAESFDFREALERYADAAGCRAVVSMTGFPLVGGHNRCEADLSVDFLAARGRPYFTPPGLMVQDVAGWTRSRLGLAPMEVAMELAIHELEGGIEPIVLQGGDAEKGRELVPERLPRFVGRLERWLALADKPAAAKKILVTVFSFPPGKGSVGTAAYLDVMRSTWAVLRRLRDEGYLVELPSSPEELLDRIVEGDDKSAPVHAASLAVGARLPVADYERIAPGARRVEKMWGAPPGALNSDGRELLIHGVDLGHVFVGVQPSFGYEGDPMRLLFDRGATPHHGFLAYYAWAEHVWRADAMVHVGTHGALEFMPGKQTGLSAACWPDQLAGSLPNLYLYAINNPSEGTIAKRRGSAVTIGHLTPPTDRAGLFAELATMKSMIGDIRADEDAARRRRSAEALVEMVRKHDLDADVVMPATRSDEDVDAFLGSLWVALTEIESRRIPVGLHTIGRRPDRHERLELLAAIAEHDRPEADVVSLPRLALQARGADVEELRTQARQREEAAVRVWDGLAETTRAVVAALLDEGPEAAAATARARAPALDEAKLARLLDHLAAIDSRLDEADELTPLGEGLRGRYVPPGPGGDPVRSPDVLPTGRNLHALDPGSVPSPAALRHAEDVVAILLERCRREQGRDPRTIGLVLWGLDNIKTQGEGIAQALLLLGVRPRPNSIGRMTELEVIPLEELGRPRIDVLLTTSGIFRDIFGLQLALLDRAVRLVADLDEPESMNHVRARARALAQAGFDPDRARTRVFSNSPGAYGTNVDHMVNLSSWDERADLAGVFARRKGFAFGSDLDGVRDVELFSTLAAGIETTFQNIDSAEVSITDVDHYFEYLGGLTALVESRTGHRPPALLADATSARTTIRALDETIRLETRTKLLNPKWYEGMLRHGYEGVEEIKKRLDYTFGWSATCEAVDPWVYREAHRTFVEDQDVRRRMQQANLHSYTAMIHRLIEADSRGFWQPTSDQRAALHQVGADVEDAIEGVASEG